MIKKTNIFLTIIFLFTTILICVFTFTGCTHKIVKKDGIIYEKGTYYDINKVEHEIYYVAGCYEDVKVLNIASEINGLPVEYFRENAFSDCLHIEEIIIPSSMKKPHKNVTVFEGCSNVKKITAPWSDFTILFFSDAENLANTNNRLPESLEVVYLSNACTKIETRDFYRCKTLKEIHIPNSVEYIEDGSNYTFIGVNGNGVPAMFEYLPFFECSPDLKIYCEVENKPDGWGSFWNYVNDWQKATVFWGGSNSNESIGDDKTQVLKHIATANKSTIDNFYSSGSSITITGGKITINLEKNYNSCGFEWDLSAIDLKSNTRYVVILENILIEDIAYDDVRFGLRFLDSGAYKYYHVKGQRFDEVRGLISDSYYHYITNLNYKSLPMEFEFINDDIEESTNKRMYFDFSGVEKKISFDKVAIYEITYE